MQKKPECRVIPEETNARFFAQQFKAYDYFGKRVAGKKILDLGCGDGYGAAYLSKLAGEVIGVDYEEEIITKAREKYRNPNLRFLAMDATQLQFDDSSFDAVCSFQVIEHIPEEQMKDYLNGIKRVLKGGGEFYCTTLNLSHNLKSPLTYKKGPAHTKEFYFQEFKGLLENVFPYVEINYLYLTPKHYSFLALKRSGIFNFLPDSINPVKIFYDRVNVSDFCVSSARSLNKRRAIDFYAVSKK